MNRALGQGFKQHHATPTSPTLRPHHVCLHPPPLLPFDSYRSRFASRSPFRAHSSARHASPSPRSPSPHHHASASPTPPPRLRTVLFGGDGDAEVTIARETPAATLGMELMRVSATEPAVDEDAGMPHVALSMVAVAPWPADAAEK